MVPQEEDRGVESGEESVIIDGKEVIKHVEHEIDGIGEPAAPEDDIAGD
ncbi:MAG: hypothetical protein WC050_00015 [Candidatus Paceibacterota bacterium]